MRNGSSNTESPPPAPSSPRAPPQRPDDGALPPGSQRFVITSAALALGIAGLYFGRSVLIPLAFAAFLAFVLDPIVAWLRRWHLPRAAAVTVVIVLALGVLGMVAAMLTQQVVTLAQELPTYRSTIHKKLVDLQPKPGSSQVMTKATRAIDMVEQEINAARIALEPAIRATPAATRAPTRVVVQTEPLPPLRALASLLEPIAVPLVSTGLVFVLLAFLLVERRELRDRVIRLTGGDLHLMSEAMNESARRVSRYLGAQLLVNLGYGLPMAVGLWWIGVPGAWLWGFMAAVLRFVPYLGFAVAAIFPLVLAFAVDPGWSMVLWTMALVLSLEILIANIVEPLAYGRRTGVSPVAVLLSAGFWTLVWGPVGLVLATPITVCLVVMGRHLGPLRFLNVLLGTEPVFNPPTKLYHRLISGDLEEAIELSHETMKREGLMAFYSATAVPMLALAATPSAREASAAQRHRIVTGAARIIEDLSRDIAFRADAQNARVLCLGARNEMDTLSAEMLAHVLREQGTAARAVPAVSLTAGHIAQLDLSGVVLVYLCTFNPAPQTFTRYVSRQLRRRAADVEIVLAAWVASDALRERDAVHDLGADDLAVSLVEAVGHAAAVHALALPAQPATPQSDHRDNLPPAPS